MKTNSRWVAALVAAPLLLARADGIPTSAPLAYGGTLQESGVLVNGMRALTLNVWDDPTATAALNLKCVTTSTTTVVTNGRFSIPLDAGCLAAINANPNLFIEVVVGTTSLGRKKLAAVPYAVEAQRASVAAGALATQVVPAGAVMHFNLPSCPTGWTELTSAQGRYLVGLPVGGTLGGGVGTALTNNENRSAGAHLHPVSESPHDHPIAPHNHVININEVPHSHTTALTNTTGGNPWYQANFGAGNTPVASTNPAMTNITASSNSNTAALFTNTRSTAIAVNNSSGPTGTNAPYLQLRVCQKN